MGEDTKLIEVDKSVLNDEGFTPPGVDHFIKAISDYSHKLLKHTTLNADAERLEDEAREVTSLHVRNAAKAIALKPPEKPRSPWSIAGQVGEYVFAAGAGIGAGHLDKIPGQITFGVCLALAVILLVVRLVKSGR